MTILRQLLSSQKIYSQLKTYGMTKFYDQFIRQYKALGKGQFTEKLGMKLGRTK